MDIEEAVGNLNDEVKEKSEGLPWRKMRGLRNIVAHAYHRVDPARIWLLVTETLPETHHRIKLLIQNVRNESFQDDNDS
jgi:uncharacterized protein with HEPN domain